MPSDYQLMNDKGKTVSYRGFIATEALTDGGNKFWLNDIIALIILCDYLMNRLVDLQKKINCPINW